MAMLEGVASVLGVSVPVARFLVCFVASIPCSFLSRFVPAGGFRNLFAAFTGVILSYYSFGAGANLYFCFPILVSYGSMILYRRNCGLFTFLAAFTFLITCHVMMMSGDAWKHGGIDTTGAMMILTLKVISAAMNYQDGMKGNEEGLLDSQRRNRLTELPSPITFLGYCLNCGTHLAGPVYEIKDYIDWTEDKGLWSPDAEKPFPSPYGAAFRSFLKALLCMGVYMFLLPRVPLSMFSSVEYQKWGFWHRLEYMYLSGFTARWKYYFIWSIAEVVVTISGLGFSGWTTSPTSSEPKPKWTRAKNIDIMKVELAKSGVELPIFGTSLSAHGFAIDVYERLVPKGGKAGFAQLLATQVTSAVWHGLYFGYLLYFIHSALMIAGSRVIYKWQMAIPEKWVAARRMGHVINGLFGALVNNYACIGFLLLSRKDTMEAYGSVYYVGTLIPLMIILSSYVIKPPKSAKKTKKAE